MCSDKLLKVNFICGLQRKQTQTRQEENEKKATHVKKTRQKSSFNRFFVIKN